MPTLGDTHRCALFAHLRSGRSDKAQDRRVTGLRRPLEKGQFLADGVGKVGLEHETLTLSHKFASKRVGHPSGGISVDIQFPSQHVCIDEAQAGWLEMGMVERGLVRS